MKRGQRRKERRGSSVVLEARNRDRRRSDCECNREGKEVFALEPGHEDIVV
jgi:hypothetical protein